MRALFAALALSLIGGAAVAQTTLTRSESTTTGKLTRIAVSPNLKQDCSTGQTPEVKVTGAPKNGTVVTRGAKAKTPASYRCPNVEAQVQSVYYQSNPKFTGSDEATFEIKTADGAVQRITVKITVTATETKKPAEKSGTDL